MIGAVVLAAGLSRRFGAPKVVAPWHGAPLVRHVIDRLILGGVTELVVTAGTHAGTIADAARGTIARIVSNRPRGLWMWWWPSP